MLLDLSQELPRARDSDTYWEHAKQVLSRNPKDIPFALFYSTETDDRVPGSTSTNRAADEQYQYALRGSIGIHGDLSAGLSRLDFRQDHGLIKYFKQAAVADKPLTIDLAQSSETSQLAQEVQLQNADDACGTAVICPLHLTSSETILGFMVLGLSKYFFITLCEDIG
jgi:hypothetical protein